MEDIYAPKTWLAYATLLQEAVAEFEIPSHPELLDQPIETLPERLYQLDLSSSESIEAAVRYFSRNKTWPKISPAESICIYVRLESAWRDLFLLATLTSNGHPILIPTGPDESEEEAIYEWCLIKLWNDHGRRKIASTLQSIRRLLEPSRS